MTASFLNQAWLNTIKQVDTNFEGSFYQKLGLSDILCSTCGAHCKVVDGNLICLNACHLIPESQDRFHKLWLLLSGNSIEEVLARAMKEVGDESS